MEQGNVDLDVARQFTIDWFVKAFNQSLVQQYNISNKMPEVCSEEDIKTEKLHEFFAFKQISPKNKINNDYFILFKKLKRYSKKRLRFFSKQRNWIYFKQTRKYINFKKSCIQDLYPPTDIKEIKSNQGNGSQLQSQSSIKKSMFEAQEKNYHSGNLSSMEYFTLKLNNAVDERQKSREKLKSRRSSIENAFSHPTTTTNTNTQNKFNKNEHKEKMSAKNNHEFAHGQKKIINREKAKSRLNQDIDFKNLTKEEVYTIKKKLKKIKKRERANRKKKELSENKE